MNRNMLHVLMTGVVLMAVVQVVQGSQVAMHSVHFPEKVPVEVSLTPTPIAPSAQIVTYTNYKRGQARIELFYRYMKPAILFGGDVTCYVVWAVTRDGNAENLGELLTRKMRGKLTFSTGKKSFGLMVTAESFYLVRQPSELVLFYNEPSVTEGVESIPFTFANLGAAPRHSMDAISHIKWDSKVPLELLQARKAFELATQNDARIHATQIHIEAEVALETANAMASSDSRSTEMLDTARRAVALSNEALNISVRRIEAMEVERQLARRREETEALERRATEAESAARDAERLAAQVRSDAEIAFIEKERMISATAALRLEKSSLESAMLQLREDKRDLETGSARLQGEKVALENESKRLVEEKAEMARIAERLRREKAAVAREAKALQQEKDELSGRLKSALSQVAETNESGRGLVVNLPDILFDLNEATLKPEAQLVLAKLTGILLLLPDQGALVEGHTDSTGAPGYNLDLSRRRANAVARFLHSQGLNSNRLKAKGFGMERPVADNASRTGRQKNRRVEIIISERDGPIASK